MTAHVALALSEVEASPILGSTEPALSTVEWAASPPQDGFAAAEPVGFGCQPKCIFL
jgi:hypothetical protein